MAIFTKITRNASQRTLSCEEANQFIMDFLDGTADEPIRMAFAAHLSTCPNCVAFLEQYRETIRLSRGARDVAIPPEVVCRTIEFLQRHL